MFSSKLEKYEHMRRIIFSTSFAISTLLNASGASAVKDPPATVAFVEIPRYLGSWYELSRMPNSFQDNSRGGYGVCYNTIATYTARSSTKINVENKCDRFNEAGEKEVEVAKARGSIVEDSGNAKLKVNFTGLLILDVLGIGDGDYWILGLGPINREGYYSWAFVGTPKRDFGWVLSRTRELPSVEARKIKNLIVEKGYSLSSFKSFWR